MRFKVSFESDTEADLPALQEAIATFGKGTVSVTRDVHEHAPPEPKAAPKPEAAPPPPSRPASVNGEDLGPAKRRGPPGRPPKVVETRVDDPVVPQNADDVLADEPLLKTVRDWMGSNRSLYKAVSNLLRQFDCERVTQLPMERRAEFLADMHGLAVQ